MKRKRITERFPFLLPIRKFQRNLFFYTQMKFDSNRYSNTLAKDLLEYEVFSAKSTLINHNSGYDLKYQINKVDNLKLVAKTMDGVIILPGETFSFWMLAKNAEKHGKYKDGLVLINNQIRPLKSGGICQLSNLLFWLFIHTPLTIVERHSHSTETIPQPKGEFPEGVDATISEGWLDIKLKNETRETFQLSLTFDEDFLYGRILSDTFQEILYSIKSENLRYAKEDQKIYRYNQIYKKGHSFSTNKMLSREMILDNKVEIQYDIESEIGFVKEGNTKWEKQLSL